MLLFRRYIEPRCSYCTYGTDLGRGEVACIKRGIMAASGDCTSFRYEPTKRTPEYGRSLNVQDITEADFAL